MSFTNVLLVGVGGLIGSVARYACSIWIGQKFDSTFPYGTFTVNILGSFILGAVYAWAANNQNDVTSVRLFLLTGFCGGFTTFSAFAFENYGLISNRAFATSFSYVALTIVLGVLAVWGGIYLAKKII